MASNPPVLSPQESFISMRELDPSPVDDSPIEISRSDYFPSGSTKQSTPLGRSTASLGLGDHSTVWWSHLTNTSIIPLITQSVGASENYLLLTRPYYQSPIFEPLVVFAPIALHVASGIGLRLYRRRQSVKWYGAESKAERKKLAWPKLSGTSLLGYMFWSAMIAHTYVNRGLPLLLEGGSSGVGLSYVAHGFARHPIIAYTAYAGLLGLGVSHIIWGGAKWLRWTPDTATGVNGYERQQVQRRRWYIINGIALATIVLWSAGGLGIIARGGAAMGWKARNYDKLFHYIPFIGGWLVP